MISLYHPNKSNTGSACSFSQNAKDGTIWAALVKQDTWDAEKRIGSFLGSRGNPEKHINIKLGVAEVGAILDALDRFRPFSTVHVTDKDTKSINFSLWLSKPDKPEDQPVPKGYSFVITLTNKEDTTKKTPFYIALTFGEGRLIREFLIYSLQKAFEINQENYAASQDAPTQ